MASTERELDRRSGRLVGASETSKEHAEWRRLQRKNLKMLRLLKGKGRPQCHNDSSYEVRQSLLCQKGKKQNLMPRAPDRKRAFRVTEVKRAAPKERKRDEYSSAEEQ